MARFLRFCIFNWYKPSTMIRSTILLFILLFGFGKAQAQTAEAYVAMADASMMLDEHENALKYCNSALALEPNNLDAKLIRGGLYATFINEPDEAIEDLQYCLNEDFQTNQVHFFLGKAYTRKSLYSEALVHAEIAANSTNIEGYSMNEAYYARGVCLHKLKREQEAIVDFTRVVDDWSWHMQAYWSRGECYFAINEFDKAIEDLTKALSMATNDSEKGIIITSRGDAKRDNGNKDAACEDYEKGEAYGYIIAGLRLIGCTTDLEPYKEPVEKIESTPEETQPKKPLFQVQVGGSWTKQSYFIEKDICPTIKKGLTGMANTFSDLKGELVREDLVWGSKYAVNFVDDDCKSMELTIAPDFASFYVNYPTGTWDDGIPDYDLNKSYLDLVALVEGCIEESGYEISTWENRDDTEGLEKYMRILDKRYSESDKLNYRYKRGSVTVSWQSDIDVMRVNFFLSL
jgi:tetratricopeptide (TPR) repeat protein